MHEGRWQEEMAWCPNSGLSYGAANQASLRSNVMLQCVLLEGAG